MRTILAVLLALGATAMLASHPPIPPPDPAVYEPVLVPVFLGRELLGAYGSRWVETVFIQNGNAQPASILAPYTCPAPPCSVPPVAPDSTIALSLGPLYNPSPTQPALVIYVRRTDARGLTFSERIFDRSRSATNFGTEVPVVREHELRMSAINLVGLPLADPAFRTMLRIYVPYRGSFHPDSQNEPFRIRIYEIAGSSSDRLVGEFRTAAVTSHIASYYTAAYVQLGDLASQVGLPAGTAVHRIEITPLATEPASFWAFASVTNNDTQHVTIVAPR